MNDYNALDVELLDFSYVLERRDHWLTFNVTHAVRWWMEHGIAFQVLQVRVDVVHPADFKSGSFDISWKEQEGPQLVVYSSTLSDTNKVDNQVVNPNQLFTIRS